MSIGHPIVYSTQCELELGIDYAPAIVREHGLSTLLQVARAAGLGRQLELDLGIHYAPAIVRDHGLADAHTWPLVSAKRGTSFRVHARDAWGYPSLELRAANSWPSLTLDCDEPSAVVDCLYANHLQGDGPALPRPSVVVERRSNSHSHVSWFLAKPVHRGESARAAPLRKLARITEYYREVLKADRGFVNCLTHNPIEETHGAGTFQTHWGRSCGYSLDELAEPIPKGWRLPAAPSTEPGRNCALFGSLLKWAGALANLDLPVLAMARATNDGLDVPLGDSEVAGLAKSVEGYRDGWIAKGRFYTEAEREAWGRSLGLAGGKVRRAAVASRDKFIMQGRAEGMSTRALARAFKLSQNAIQNVIRRDTDPDHSKG